MLNIADSFLSRTPESGKIQMNAIRWYETCCFISHKFEKSNDKIKIFLKIFIFGDVFAETLVFHLKKMRAKTRKMSKKREI